MTTEYRVTWLRRSVSGRAIPMEEIFVTEEAVDALVRELVRGNSGMGLEVSRKIQVQERTVSLWVTTREIAS